MVRASTATGLLLLDGAAAAGCGGGDAELLGTASDAAFVADWLLLAGGEGVGPADAAAACCCCCSSCCWICWREGGPGLEVTLPRLLTWVHF